MDLLDASLLLLAGLGAGTVNAVAGGGSLVTFPSLLAVGLPPIAATVTNSVSVCPGYLASVFGSRTDLKDLARARGRRSLLALIPTVVAGTAIGCTLLLTTPARTFDFVVPFLVLGATAVLAFQDRLKALASHGGRLGTRGGRLGTRGGRPRNHSGQDDRTAGESNVPLHIAAGLAAIYGGYFNAALGVMLVAVLGLAIDDTLARVSALKNAVSAVVGIGAVVAYAAFGPVNWAAVAVLTPATLLGGYTGARLARRLPSTLLRVVIVIFGTTVGIVLLVRALA